MKNVSTSILLTAGSLVLAACAADQPAPAAPESRVIYRDPPPSRSSASSKPAGSTPNSPDNFEPVERPVSYSH